MILTSSRYYYHHHLQSLLMMSRGKEQDQQQLEQQQQQQQQQQILLTQLEQESKHQQQRREKEPPQEQQEQQKRRRQRCRYDRCSFVSVSSRMSIMMIVFMIGYCCLVGIVVNAINSNTDVTNNIGGTIGDSETMDRVYERIDTYMKVPVETVQRLATFRTLGYGFPYGMTAPDRVLLMNYLYTELIANTFDGTILFFALEDGTFQYYTDPYSADFREPGNAGYDVSNITVNDPYYKNYVSCVDESGQQSNCTLGVGESYIECVNDCELIPCQTITSDQGNNNNSSKTKFCRNYIVQQVQENELRGYIPDTYICINSNGQPEQRDGYVWKAPPEDDADSTEIKTSSTGASGVLDKCYYADGITEVNRSLYGMYSSCSSDSKSSDVYGGCTDAFKGGYESPEYDARYRDWYVNTKIAQEAIWTPPYTFSFANAMGITYSLPIYTSKIGNEEVFDGVIAVDYFLESINSFLIQYYSNTNLQVFIMELDGPMNYLIASSKVNGQVSKKVLTEDETLPCPPAVGVDDSGLCSIIRVSIQEYKNSNDTYDQILYGAYESHNQYDKIMKQKYSTNTTHLYYKVNENSIGSAAYIAKRKLYQQGISLNWYIYVIQPMERSTNDSIQVGQASFIIVILIGIIGFIGCNMLLYILLQYRKEKAMVHADWRFTAAFIAGCAAINLSTFTLIGDNTNQTCMLRMWSFNGLFVCALSPLFAKVWRMYRLLTVGVQRSNLNNFHAFLLTLPLIIIEMTILTIFTFIDPPKQTETLGASSSDSSSSNGNINMSDDNVYQQVTCSQETNSFFITQFVFDACLVFMGCILAYQTRDLDPKFGEAKQLGFSMYNVAFTGIVVVCIIQFVNLDQTTIIVLRAVGVLWGSFFCSCAFVIPRWLEIRKEKQIQYALQHRGGSRSKYIPSRVKSYFEKSRVSTIDSSENKGKNYASTSKSNLKTKPTRASNATNTTSNIGQSRNILSSNRSSSARSARDTNINVSTDSNNMLTWETTIEMSGVEGSVAEVVHDSA